MWKRTLCEKDRERKNVKGIKLIAIIYFLSFMKWFEKLSGRWIANLMNTSLTRTRRTRSSKPTHLHFSWVSSRLILADTLSRRMNESCLFVDCKVIPGNSCVPEAQTVSVSDEFVVGAMVFNCLARPKTILTAIFVFQNFVWTAGMYLEENKSFSWDLDLCTRTLIVPVRPEELFWVLFNWFFATDSVHRNSHGCLKN